MYQLAEDIFICLRNIDITAKQEAAFKALAHGHICEHPFSPGNRKVSSHKDTHVIPIVFHNVLGYDAYFIRSDTSI